MIGKPAAVRNLRKSSKNRTKIAFWPRLVRLGQPRALSLIRAKGEQKDKEKKIIIVFEGNVLNEV